MTELRLSVLEGAFVKFAEELDLAIQTRQLHAFVDLSQRMAPVVAEIRARRVEADFVHQKPDIIAHPDVGLEGRFESLEIA